MKMLSSTTPTVPQVPMTMGWSKGIADQLSLPNISECLFGRPTRRHLPLCDRVKRVIWHGTVSQLPTRSRGSGQLGKARALEYSTLFARLRDPGGKALAGLSAQSEPHIGESGSAELRGKTRVGTGLISLQIELSRHA